MRGTHITMSALLGIGLVLGACAADEPSEGAGKPATERVAASGPREVVIRTRDYEFDAPDTIASGPVTFRLINEGPDFHHVWLVRLEDGKTFDDLMQYLDGQHRPMPSWAVDVGGPNTPGVVGGETNATLDLEPGDYALLCAIPNADGGTHLMRSMSQPLTVVPAAGPERTMPEADIVMTLDDYSYELDRPITPGRRVVRVENVAPQAHEVVIVRMRPGKKAGDFLRWVQTREGEPPGEMIAGVTGIQAGESNLITVDFDPGAYALLCFVPDAGDLAPHVVHGMVRDITVG